MRIHVSLFWNWSRCVWQETTMPVGLWMSRTADDVLLMCWPPAPDEAVDLHFNVLGANFDFNVVGISG